MAPEEREKLISESVAKHVALRKQLGHWAMIVSIANDVKGTGLTVNDQIEIENRVYTA